VDDEDFKNRTSEFQRVPDGYIRRESLFKVVGAAVGILGALLGLFRFLDAFREYTDRSVQNERIERINQFNRIDQRIDECCSRRVR